MNLLQFAEKMAVAAIEIQHHMGDGIEKACILLKDTAKDAMGDPGNGFGWAPLKPETIARKANGNTPLVETGEMKESIQHNSDSREGYVGTNDEKAAWHEFGTSKIPARPFLGGAVAAKGEEAAKLVGGEALKGILGPVKP